MALKDLFPSLFLKPILVCVCVETSPHFEKATYYEVRYQVANIEHLYLLNILILIC